MTTQNDVPGIPQTAQERYAKTPKGIAARRRAMAKYALTGAGKAARKRAYVARRERLSKETAEQRDGRRYGVRASREEREFLLDFPGGPWSREFRDFRRGLRLPWPMYDHPLALSGRFPAPSADVLAALVAEETAPFLTTYP